MSDLEPDAQSVLQFWLEEIGPTGWYVSDPSIDDAIRDRFEPAVRRAIAGDLDDWADTAHGALALLILLDQFPRNLHRGKADAFQGDEKARTIARAAVAKNLDLETAEPGRQFFYLPFEHSENIADQDWSVALFEARTPNLPEQSMYHVRQHRDVIAQFGRFPFRNDALNREPTAEEAAFMQAGGYSPGLQPEE